MNNNISPASVNEDELPTGFTSANPGAPSQEQQSEEQQRQAQKEAVLEQALTQEALARLRRIKVRRTTIMVRIVTEIALTN